MKFSKQAKYIKAESAKIRSSATTAVEHAINVGITLFEVKDGLPHGEFSKWVEDNVDLTLQHANKCMRLGVHKAQVRSISCQSAEPVTINELCEVLPKTSEEPIITKADPATLGYAGVSEHNRKTRDTDDWHTPSEYTDDARKVMGSIDFDPFSTPEANVSVEATRFLTKADDAFATDWASPETRNVWMNPPYGRGIMTKAIQRFLDQYDAGAFQQAVVLCNAATDTYWFHDMWRASEAYYLTLGRIAFITGDKELSGNTKGQAFFYFGPNLERFRDVFAKHGGFVDARGYK